MVSACISSTEMNTQRCLRKICDAQRNKADVERVRYADAQVAGELGGAPGMVRKPSSISCKPPRLRQQPFAGLGDHHTLADAVEQPAADFQIRAA